MEPEKDFPTPQPPLILVADADSDAARRLAEYLSERGLRTAHTSSGKDVLSGALSGRLRLAIVDVALEDMSGHSVASRLREIDAAIPILMTAGDSRPEVEIQARQVGIVYYAHKPLDYSLLEAVVIKAICRSQRG